MRQSHFWKFFFWIMISLGEVVTLAITWNHQQEKEILNYILVNISVYDYSNLIAYDIKIVHLYY